MQTAKRDKLIKKAIRLRKMEALISKKAKVGKERFIETTYGNVRVLEYGFDRMDTAQSKTST